MNFLNFEDVSVSAVAGKTETEIAIYARIGNMDGLNRAQSVVEQEQYDTRIGKDKQRCRVRKEVRDGIIEYTFTYKIPLDHDGVEKMVEHTVPIDESFWHDFRLLSDRHTHKRRYVFPARRCKLTREVEGQSVTVDLPDMKFEVDVYLDAENNPVGWCKIDIEIDDLERHLKDDYQLTLDDVQLHTTVSHLPFQPTEMIDGRSTDPQDKQTLSDLWEHKFKLPV